MTKHASQRFGIQLGATLVVLVGLGSSVGCSDDGNDGAAGLRIETSVDTTELVAGTEIRVNCQAYRGGSLDDSITSWELRVAPTPSTVIASDRFSAEKAGKYEIACAVANSMDVDDTPITVKVVAAEPSRSVASVDPSTTKAGEATTVSCSLQDGFGNEVSQSDWTPNVTPKDSVEVSGVQLSATGQGAYQVECVFDGYTVPAETSTWVVEPGEPARLVLALDPLQDVYPVATVLTVKADVYDAFDNRLEAASELDTLTSTPSDGFKVDVADSEVEFEKGGEFVLLGESGELSGELTVIVDGERPSVDLTVPARGTTKDGDPQLTVSGTATDDRGVQSVTVNGEAAEVEAATGKFTADWPLKYGIDWVHVVVTDVAGNVGETWRSVTWSDDWYTLGEDPTKDVVDNGLTVILTQALLDDGNHDPNNPDDVATLAEVIMNGLDLKALIPNPLGTILGCDYVMKEINLKPVTIGLQLAEDKMLVDVVIQNFVLRVKNEGGWQCFFNGNGTGPLQYLADVLTVKAELSFETVDGLEVPKVTILDVESDGTFNLNIVIIEDIVDAFFDLVFDIFKGLIGEALNLVFEELVGQFALDIPFELPAIGDGEPNTLLISASPTDFEITPDALILGLDTQVTAQDAKRPHAVLGAPKYSGCGEVSELPAGDKLGWPMLLSLHDEVLNQLMFAIWDGGTLNLKLGATDLGDLDLSSFGISDLSVDVDGFVAPFFNTCEPGNNVIQLGDLWVDATMDFVGTPTHIAMWIQGGVPLTLEAVEGESGGSEIGFTLGDLDGIMIEVVTNEGIFAGNDQAVVDLIKETLLGSLLDGLLADLGSFPLPEVNLNEIAPELPEGAVLKVDIANIATEGGRILVSGGLN